MSRILLVESDELLRQFLVSRLAAAGFEVSVASDARTARAALSREPADAAVIDLELPDGTGIELRDLLRKEAPRLPVLLLSAAGKDIEGLGGLTAGDDFLTSPYRGRDLVLRLNVLLRLATDRDYQTVLHAGTLELDLDRHETRLAGSPVKLTTKEFDLLRELLEARGRILPRETLMERVWGYQKDSGILTRTLDVHIRRLRKKLGPEGRRILTLRNVGYRLDMAADNLRAAAAESLRDAENLRAAESLRRMVQTQDNDNLREDSVPPAIGSLPSDEEKRGAEEGAFESPVPKERSEEDVEGRLDAVRKSNEPARRRTIRRIEKM